MKTYRIFELDENENYKLKGQIRIRLDEDNRKIIKMLRSLGMHINNYRNKMLWWDDEYAEIIQKKSEKTVGVIEVVYGK